MSPAQAHAGTLKVLKSHLAVAYIIDCACQWIASSQKSIKQRRELETVPSIQTLTQTKRLAKYQCIF